MESNFESMFQNAIDTVTSEQDLDILYMTSIGFLIVLTIAIISSIISYRNCK